MRSDVSDVWRHLDLALRFLEEGKALVDKDPVQASEKLYKATEECVKALAIHYNLSDILEVVEKRGRWTVTELDKVVRRLYKVVGKWLKDSWESANYLHIWGFHEAKLDQEAVKSDLPDIERMVIEVKKIISEAYR
jgi:hypothetical protein